MRIFGFELTIRKADRELRQGGTMESEKLIHAMTTGNAENLTNEEKIEHFDLLLTEYRRLHGWTAVCLGSEVAQLHGLKVDG